MLLFFDNVSDNWQMKISLFAFYLAAFGCTINIRNKQNEFLRAFTLINEVDEMFKSLGIFSDYFKEQIACILIVFISFSTSPFYELLYYMTYSPIQSIWCRTVATVYNFNVLYCGLLTTKIIFILLFKRIHYLHEIFNTFEDLQDQTTKFDTIMRIQTNINNIVELLNKTFGYNIYIMYVSCLLILIMWVQNRVFDAKLLIVWVVWCTSLIPPFFIFTFMSNYYHFLVRSLIIFFNSIFA